MSKLEKELLIRFKGFTKAWEKQRLGEVSQFAKGFGYSKNDLRENGTPIVLYGRLYTKYETIIYDVDTFVEQKSNSIYSTGEEVIVPASGETAEDIARASAVGKSGIILGGDLNIIYPINLNTVFLALLISNGEQQKSLSKKAQGKSVVHLHNSDLKEVIITYPYKEEQTKIGNFFNTIDTLITLHQRKCDLLEQTKKTYLQKQFPRDGENVPEMRFPGFEGKWEEKELGEVLIERNTQIPENEDYPLMSFVQGKGVTPKGERYDRSFLVRDEDKKYKVTKYGDFIYSSNNLETGSIGFNRTGNAVISPVYSIFSSKNALESLFIGILSMRKDFIGKMTKYRQGVVYGQWRIHESDFLKITNRMPIEDEQKKIVDMFSNIAI